VIIFPSSELIKRWSLHVEEEREGRKGEADKKYEIVPGEILICKYNFLKYSMVSDVTSFHLQSSGLRI